MKKILFIIGVACGLSSSPFLLSLSPSFGLLPKISVVEARPAKKERVKKAKPAPKRSRVAKRGKALPARNFEPATPSKSTAAEQALSLPQRIERLVSEYESPSVQVGVMVQNLNNSEIVYESNREVPLNPASNLKVLTTYSALQELGKDYRFKTQILGSGKSKGAQIPTLTLKGFGDPSFTSERLDQMAAELAGRGVKRVDQVMIDHTFFDSEDFPGRFYDRQLDSTFNAPVSALAIDQNVHKITVSPTAPGRAASVELTPPLPNYPIVRAALTGGRNSIIVKNLRETPEDYRLQVQGRIAPKARGLTYLIAQNHPSKTTGLRFLDALKRAGITAPDTFEAASVAVKGDVLVESLSEPLPVILQEINKNSNNFMTEQLTKVLGAEVYGAPGTTEKGTQVVLKQLKQAGADISRVFLENGCGLSQKNRITVGQLGSILRLAFHDGKIQSDFLSSLSILGVDGTLRRKFHDRALANSFLGKTGTMNGVTSLSGYAYPREAAGPFLIATISNGQGAGFWRQKEFQHRLLQLVINQ